MALRKIALHFDVISPYSWIGFELLHRHNRLWNDPTIIVENKPTFLSGIMQGSGNKPPGVVPDKMKYMMYDMQRLNKFTQIPIHPISDPFTTLFKKGSTMPMRVLTAMQNEEPDLVYDAATQIWHKIWQYDLDITDPEVITDALSKAGISGEKAAYYIGKTTEQEIKDKLKEVTQEGLDMGMFGAPSFIVRQDGHDDVMFFGQDRIELLCDHLGVQYHGAAIAGKK